MKNNIERLHEDHNNARRLAAGLSDIPALDLDSVQSNMVFAAVPEERIGGLVAHFQNHQILTAGCSGEKLRLVTPLDVSAEEIDMVIAATQDYFA